MREFHRRQGEQGEAEVRCMRHQSSIIIYCLHDRQLLCPNCVFTDATHKKHRVIEAIKAASEVDKDIEKYSKPLGARDVNIR